MRWGAASSWTICGCPRYAESLLSSVGIGTISKSSRPHCRISRRFGGSAKIRGNGTTMWSSSILTICGAQFHVSLQTFFAEKPKLSPMARTRGGGASRFLSVRRSRRPNARYCHGKEGQSIFADTLALRCAVRSGENPQPAQNQSRAARWPSLPSRSSFCRFSSCYPGECRNSIGCETL